MHSDIVRPLESSYPNRYRYFATFQDDHSRNDFAGMMRHRSDLSDVFMEFTQRFSRMMSKTTGVLSFPKGHEHSFKKAASCIKKNQSNNTKEYIRLGNDLGSGVDKSYSPMYTPELNAIAERINRTIDDASRSMLI